MCIKFVSQLFISDVGFCKLTLKESCYAVALLTPIEKTFRGFSFVDLIMQFFVQLQVIVA
jgi:hypothetical protein